MDTRIGLHPRQGLAQALVAAASAEAQRAGCEWLHADDEPELVGFYEGACGLQHTEAGLARLRPVGTK